MARRRAAIFKMPLEGVDAVLEAEVAGDRDEISVLDRPPALEPMTTAGD